MIQVKSFKPGSREWYEQAINLSIYTNARARDTDALPDPLSQDKQGSWDDIFVQGDEQRGSRLWTINRSTLTINTANIMRGMLEECLEWMRPRWAKKVDVTVERCGDYMFVFQLTVWVSDNQKITMEINYAVK